MIQVQTIHFGGLMSVKVNGRFYNFLSEDDATCLNQAIEQYITHGEWPRTFINIVDISTGSETIVHCEVIARENWRGYRDSTVVYTHTLSRETLYTIMAAFVIVLAGVIYTLLPNVH